MAWIQVILDNVLNEPPGGADIMEILLSFISFLTFFSRLCGCKANEMKTFTFLLFVSVYISQFYSELKSF